MESRFFCGHCGEKISRSLYFQHKKLYYTPESQQWERTLQNEHDSVQEDFTFSDNEQEDPIDGQESMEVHPVGEDPPVGEDQTPETSDDDCTDFDFDQVRCSYSYAIQ